MEVPDFYYNLLKFLKDNNIKSVQYVEENDSIYFTKEVPSKNGGTVCSRYEFDAYGMEDNIVEYIQESIDYIENFKEDDD